MMVKTDDVDVNAVVCCTRMSGRNGECRHAIGKFRKVWKKLEKWSIFSTQFRFGKNPFRTSSSRSNKSIAMTLILRPDGADLSISVIWLVKECWRDKRFSSSCSYKSLSHWFISTITSINSTEIECSRLVSCETDSCSIWSSTLSSASFHSISSSFSFISISCWVLCWAKLSEDWE